MRWIAFAVVLLACSSSPEADLGLSREDARKVWGAECDPKELTACGILQFSEGGWCDSEHTNGARPECVIQCGERCDEWGGICSTEGICFAPRE